MSDSEERKQIVRHFMNAAVGSKPPPKHVLDNLHASLEGALAETVQGDNEIEFVEPREPGPGDSDDFGSVLVLAGGHLYAIEASRTQIKMSVVGDLSGGSYSERSELDYGELIETTIRYEHPRLEDGAIVLTFPPQDAERYRPIRKRLRVWGARTIASPLAEGLAKRGRPVLMRLPGVAGASATHESCGLSHRAAWASCTHCFNV